MRILIPPALVAIGLAVLLLLRPTLVPKWVYLAGFFLGLATLGVFSFGRGERTWELRSIGFIPSRVTLIGSLILVSFLASTPYLLLLESGIAGYRGFSSWMRYLSLGIAFLGGSGLVAAFLVPRLLRR
jgi:hypothetical protein